MTCLENEKCAGHREAGDKEEEVLQNISAQECGQAKGIPGALDSRVCTGSAFAQGY